MTQRSDRKTTRRSTARATFAPALVVLALSFSGNAPARHHECFACEESALKRPFAPWIELALAPDFSSAEPRPCEVCADEKRDPLLPVLLELPLERPGADRLRQVIFKLGTLSEFNRLQKLPLQPDVVSGQHIRDDDVIKSAFTLDKEFLIRWNRRSWLHVEAGWWVTYMSGEKTSSSSLETGPIAGIALDF